LINLNGLTKIVADHHSALFSLNTKGSGRNRGRGRSHEARATPRESQAAIYNVLACCRRAAACSPITTQGAIVLPVVTRGRIDASAIRRPSTP
jgi:hypothetical protein